MGVDVIIKSIRAKCRLQTTAKGRHTVTNGRSGLLGPMARCGDRFGGYDNHNHKLPEPSLQKTNLLIEMLRDFTEVRTKTLREVRNKV